MVTGWATGILLPDRAEDVARRREMRDSGVSASSHRKQSSLAPPGGGEVRAFPLVCVCLPDYWQKTIENEVHQIDEYETSTGGSDYDIPGRRREDRSPSAGDDGDGSLGLETLRSPPASVYL